MVYYLHWRTYVAFGVCHSCIGLGFTQCHVMVCVTKLLGSLVFEKWLFMCPNIQLVSDNQCFTLLTIHSVLLSFSLFVSITSRN